MKNRKTLCLPAILFIGIMLCPGCGKSTKSAPHGQAKSTALVFPVMIDAFTEFKQEFEAELQPDGIKVSTFSAEGSADRFTPSIKAALLGKPDILVTIGTQITGAALSPQFEPDLPPVIASCISAPEKVEA